jgi:hypothetical protein
MMPPLDRVLDSIERDRLANACRALRPLARFDSIALPRDRLTEPPHATIPSARVLQGAAGGMV